MKKESKRSPVPAICSALGTIILVIVILLCIPMTVPKLLGYEVYAVVSGSMEPEIPTGSLVFVKYEEPQHVQAEDVIAFYGGPGSDVIITHRVVDNRVVMGEFITKGDANKQNDMNPIDYDEFIGTVRLSIPGFGVAADFLTGPEGKVVAVCLIVLAVLLHMMSGMLEKRK